MEKKIIEVNYIYMLTQNFQLFLPGNKKTKDKIKLKKCSQIKEMFPVNSQHSTKTFLLLNNLNNLNNIYNHQFKQFKTKEDKEEEIKESKEFNQKIKEINSKNW